MMKIALLCAAASTAFAAGALSQDLEARYRAKLKKPFATRVTWHHDLKAAIAEARARDEIILGYFTRSYSP